GLGLKCRHLRRNETRFSVIGEEPPVGEEALLRRVALTQRPQHRLERVVVVIRELFQAADVEIAAAVILEGGKPGMLTENLCCGLEVKGSAKAAALCDFAHDPPVGPRLARCRKKRALA